MEWAELGACWNVVHLERGRDENGAQVSGLGNRWMRMMPFSEKEEEQQI